MKRYAAYKDSGLDWLGEIPEHWEVLRGKRLFKQVNRPTRDQDGIVTAFRDGMVTLRSNRRTEGFTNSILEIGYQGIRKGDLVIHAMDAFAGAIGVSDSDGKATPVYAVCVPINTVNVYYFAHLIRCIARNGYILSLAKGIRERSTDFRFAEFAILQLPFPSQEEQDAIVAFLDHKLAEIDHFIANKERLIELLKEQKAAIINRAVTRGIEPGVSMKPSSIEWLGEIPAHWEALRVKFLLALMEQGWSPQCEARLKKESEWGVLKVGCVNGYTFNELEHKALPDYLTPKPEYEVKVGDILISRANTRELVGGTAHVESIIPHLLLCDKLYRVRLRKNLLQPFFIHILSAQSSRKQIELGASGASDSMQNIGQDVIKNLWVTVPPIEEQTRILYYIEEQTSDIHRTIHRIEREIELIKEYRTTLISEAVTGKIDVRAAHREELPVEAGRSNRHDFQRYLGNGPGSSD